MNTYIITHSNGKITIEAHMYVIDRNNIAAFSDPKGNILARINMHNIIAIETIFAEGIL